MTDVIDQSAAPAVAVVEHDLPCAGCGYNLRSMPLAGVCPECGLPVERSLGRDNALWEARPAWLRSLAWGVGLMIAAQLTLALGAMNAHRFERLFDDERLVLSALLGATLLYAAGTWLLTRRERLFARRSGGDVTRLVGRIGAFGPVAALLFALYLASNRRPVDELDAGVMLLLNALIVPGIAGTFLYLRRLARRVLSRRMSEYATIVAVGGAISAATLLAMVGLQMAEVEGDFTSDAGFIFILLLLTALLLFYLWALLVLVLFIVAFVRAARSAGELWSAHTT